MIFLRVSFEVDYLPVAGECKIGCVKVWIVPLITFGFWLLLVWEFFPLFVKFELLFK
jgi:hypothetical protein